MPSHAPRILHLFWTLFTFPLLSLGSDGINCEGNWIYCFGASNSLMSTLVSLVPQIKPRDIYTLDSNIICFPHTNKFLEFAISSTAGYCLYFKGSDLESNIILSPYGDVVRGVNGSQIQEGVRRLSEHNCKSCGSVPVAFELNDAHRKGELSVNWVSSRDGCADEATGSNICAPAYPADSVRNPYNEWDNYRRPGEGSNSQRPSSASRVTAPPRPSITTSTLPVGFFTFSRASASPLPANVSLTQPTPYSNKPLANNTNFALNNSTLNGCAAAAANGTVDSDKCDDGSGGDPPAPDTPTKPLSSGIVTITAPPVPLDELDETSSTATDSDRPERTDCPDVLPLCRNRRPGGG